MSAEHPASDAALFAELRAMWAATDPMPEGIVERIIAAVAADDLPRELALLSLVEGAAAVRGESDTLTLQFSDGDVGVLLHIADGERAGGERGARRVDGWVDAEAEEIVLEQQGRSWMTIPAEHGRFAFEQVPPGLTRVRLTVRDRSGTRTFATPQFEV